MNPSQCPADRVSKKRFIVSLAAVLSLHLLIFWLLTSPPIAPDKPKPLRFFIELGKAPPAGASGQEAVAPLASQAVQPRKAVPAPPTTPAAAAAKSPAQLSAIAPTSAAPTSAKPEQPGPSEPPVQPQATNAAKAEPAEPVVAASAKASIEPVPSAEPDYKAAYLNNPRPPYPRNAYRFGIEGKVVLQAEVSDAGVPLKIQVFQSSGNELLDESALATVAKWRFSPVRKDGVMVRAVVNIPITFSLKAAPRGN